jgi:predicted nucleotidyltransferase
MISPNDYILKTITYGDIFDFPLRASEVQRFLISPVKFSDEEVTANLNALCTKGVLEVEEDLYFLSNRRSIALERRRRKTISEDKLRRVKPIIKLVSLLPSVKMVGLTGDLAYGNGHFGSDVDLMVVTSVGRMWLTRLIIFFTLRILGLKMADNRDPSVTKICINVWCDTDNLQIPENERDLVLASDITHLVPLSNKEGTYEKFISANLWLKDYFPNWSV